MPNSVIQMLCKLKEFKILILKEKRYNPLGILHCTDITKSINHVKQEILNEEMAVFAF